MQLKLIAVLNIEITLPGPGSPELYINLIHDSVIKYSKPGWNYPPGALSNDQNRGNTTDYHC